MLKRPSAATRCVLCATATRTPHKKRARAREVAERAETNIEKKIMYYPHVKSIIHTHTVNIIYMKVYMYNIVLLYYYILYIYTCIEGGRKRVSTGEWLYSRGKENGREQKRRLRRLSFFLFSRF